ncbi:MAG: catalase, partial [Bacteriovorax sp.]
MSLLKNKVFLASSVTSFILALYFYPTKTHIDRLPSAVQNDGAQQPKVELGESWGSEDVDHSNQILEIIENSLDKSTNGANLMRRDAHPKHHGCVKAQVLVDASALSSNQQVGVFSPNAPKEYSAWIRFSNGNPNAKKADADGDVRGMAIKLMNVSGSASGSQDFLLMNSKSFFIKDSKEYIDFMRATEGNVSLVWFLATHARTRDV